MDRWNDVKGRPLDIFSILTTTPNAVTSAVHDRMPVILNPDNYDLWLDPGLKDACSSQAWPERQSADQLQVIVIYEER
jgi:putative SOS response-associated peptidase YedK